MSIDLDVLRNDLKEHKVSLNKHTGNGQLSMYISLFGENEYVKKVKEYNKVIAKLEAFIDLFNPNSWKEFFAGINIKFDADLLLHEKLSDPALIEMNRDISSKLKDLKIYLDKINPISD